MSTMRNHRYISMCLLGMLLFLLILPYPGIATAQSLPDQAYITGVPANAQRFTLSCESRSAVDWAAFWGVRIGEKKFLNSLPRSDNPDQGFVGDANGDWGNTPPLSYGVHAEPVAVTLRSFGLQARAYRGLSWDDLRSEIAAGRPVIVWVIGQMWPGTPQQYFSRGGETTTVARFEHTMILVGYEPGKVHVVDAYTGRNQTYSQRTFMNSWKVLGKMAIFGGEIQESKPLPPDLSLLTNKLYMPVIFGHDTQLQDQPEQSSSPATYTVKRGDYLTLVARRLGVDWRQLAQRNNLSYPYVIYPGQVLHLP
jgi:uncharacterized protein YvpB